MCFIHKRAAPGPALGGTLLIEGEPKTEQILTVNTAGLSGEGEISYQWLRNDIGIPSAAGPAYTPVEGDIGGVITVRVSRADRRGSFRVCPWSLQRRRI